MIKQDHLKNMYNPLRIIHKPWREQLWVVMDTDITYTSSFLPSLFGFVFDLLKITVWCLWYQYVMSHIPQFVYNYVKNLLAHTSSKSYFKGMEIRYFQRGIRGILT